MRIWPKIVIDIKDQPIYIQSRQSRGILRIGGIIIENHWQLQDAKNKFSSLVHNAEVNGPQVVTKHGKDAVVILAVKEYKKLIKPKENLITFFKNSPLTKVNLDLTRSKDKPREVEL